MDLLQPRSSTESGSSFAMQAVGPKARAQRGGDQRTAGSADGNTRPQRRIQSIEVGFRLIRVLEEASAPLPLKTVAALAGMPPSKAHLYMVSFVRLGLVVQDPVTTRYGLGPYAVQLGLAGIRQLSIVDAARGPMQELQEKAGVAVYLSVWGNLGPAIVLKFDAALEAPMSIRVGYVLPLTTTATGRVFLACLPESEIAPVLARGRPADRKLQARVRSAVAAVRQHGIAFSDGLHYEGVTALSAPIFDHSGVIAGAMTLLGWRSHLSLDLDGAAARDLRKAAAAVSTSLGYVAGEEAPSAGTTRTGPARHP
jgi:DNA-binding IclR family transcriptional regulator